MQRSLRFDVGKCTGCLQCEIACSYAKEGLFNPAKSRIKVFHFHSEARFVPFTCTQCAEAWCAMTCPVDAIQVNDVTGAKEVNDKACVGCKVCTISCPFGAVNYDRATAKVVKCDLCAGDPECVKACPTQAIGFVDSNWTGYDKMREWAGKTDTGSQAEA
jgi:Fe-S-cluster-containing hydrogenase component 2